MNFIKKHPKEISEVFCYNRVRSKLGWLGIQILRKRFRKTRFVF